MLDDLISRQAVKELAYKQIRKQNEGFLLKEQRDFLINLADKIIDAIPPTQPEIINCKDCDWWTKQEDSVQGRCELMQMYPTGSWFCANAKRREDDDTD